MPSVESSSLIFTQPKPREVLNMVLVETSESFARMGSGRLSGTFVSNDCSSDRSGVFKLQSVHAQSKLYLLSPKGVHARRIPG